LDERRLEQMMSKDKIKDLEVTLRVRNNQLKARRLRLGLSQAELAAKAGVSPQTYNRLEVMKEGPYNSKGELREVVVKIAEVLQAPLDDLFPLRVLEINQLTTQVRYVDLDEINQLDRAHQELLLEVSEDTPLDRVEKRQDLEKLMECLSPRDKLCVCQYYGLSGEDLSVYDIGERYELSGARVMQIIHKALLKMRGYQNRVDLNPPSNFFVATQRLTAILQPHGILYRGPYLSKAQADNLESWLISQKGKGRMAQMSWAQPPIGQFIKPDKQRKSIFRRPHWRNGMLVIPSEVYEGPSDPNNL
jgi:DNA-binding XRE family transcriptional regulator